jgi:hypothetical protein
MILHVARTVRPYLQNQTGCRGQATARRDYGVNFVGIAQEQVAARRRRVCCPTAQILFVILFLDMLGFYDGL